MVNRFGSRYAVRSFGDVAVIDAPSDSDDTGAHGLRLLVERLAADGHRAVVLNLSDVRRLGVAGLGALLNACTAAARAGLTLHAVCPPRSPIALMVLAKVVTCIDVHGCEADAFAALDVDGKRRATSMRRVA